MIFDFLTTTEVINETEKSLIQILKQKLVCIPTKMVGTSEKLAFN